MEPAVSSVNINNQSAAHHRDAQQLSHAEGADDEPELCVRLPEELDEESDKPVPRDIDRNEKTLESGFFSHAPENGEEDDSFKKSLV